MLNNATQETLNLLLQAQKSGSPALASKAYNQALGLVYYDLEPVAKQLYPVITPLRNKIPRVKGDGGTATHWKAVTGININLLSPGVEEGKRGGVVVTSTQDFVGVYRGIGLEDYITFEAEWAAEHFDNVRALAVENLLRAMFISEEQVLLNANGGGLLLGICPTPAITLITGVGALGAGATRVYCVALTPEGMAYAGGPGLAAAATALQVTIARPNAGPTGGTSTYGGGTSQVSVQSNSVTTTGANLAIYATVAVVTGAAGYAWFVKGNNTASATAPLHSITTVPCQLFSADGLSTQMAAAFTADNSANALVPDGVITQVLASTGLHTSNTVPTAAAIQTAASISLAAGATLALGTVLTTNSMGGITEVDADLKSFWDNRRLSPTEMWVNSQELQSMTKLVIAAGAAPLFRFNMDAGNTNTVVAGAVVGSYLNRFTMTGGHLIPIRLHPNMTAGRILYWSDSIPYPLSNVSNIIQVKTRRDYYQIEWPLIDRTYQYGVYADQLLQIYAPFAFGVRDGIGPS